MLSLENESKIGTEAVWMFLCNLFMIHSQKFSLYWVKNGITQLKLSFPTFSLLTREKATKFRKKIKKICTPGVTTFVDHKTAKPRWKKHCLASVLGLPGHKRLSIPRSPDKSKYL